MKAGQITAKIRDAVPVYFFEGGEDRTQYKNIEIPDSLKTLEIIDFGFDISEEGKISFRLFFGNGILPAEFPPARPMMTRAAKAAAKAAKATEDGETAEVTTAVIADSEEMKEAESRVEAVEIPEQPKQAGIHFNVSGPGGRKALVAAISEYLNQQSEYLGAANGYAYAIGAYRIDRSGTLFGEASPEMLTALAEQGFKAEDSHAA